MSRGLLPNYESHTPVAFSKHAYTPHPRRAHAPATPQHTPASATLYRQCYRRSPANTLRLELTHVHNYNSYMCAVWSGGTVQHVQMNVSRLVIQLGHCGLVNGLVKSASKLLIYIYILYSCCYYYPTIPLFYMGWASSENYFVCGRVQLCMFPSSLHCRPFPATAHTVQTG